MFEKFNVSEIDTVESVNITGGGIREDAFVAGAVYEWNRRLAKGMWDLVVERWND